MEKNRLYIIGGLAVVLLGGVLLMSGGDPDMGIVELDGAEQSEDDAEQDEEGDVEN